MEEDAVLLHPKPGVDKKNDIGSLTSPEGHVCTLSSFVALHAGLGYPALASSMRPMMGTGAPLVLVLTGFSFKNHGFLVCTRSGWVLFLLIKASVVFPFLETMVIFMWRTTSSMIFY